MLGCNAQISFQIGQLLAAVFPIVHGAAATGFDPKISHGAINFAEIVLARS